MVMDRSAEAVTVVFAVAVLFPGVGSVVVDETLAVFVSDAACAGEVTMIVMVGAVAPVASVGLVQVTDTLPAFVHVHPVPVAETKVTPAGRVSVTESPAPSEGPLFTTTSEYEMPAPATTVAGPDFVIARSAEAVTVVFAVAVLLPATGSLVVDETLAVFVSDPACAGAVTTTVIVCAVVPVARAGRVHVADTLPEFVHVHPAPVADTNVTPAGRVSDTERLAASEGPLFTTTREYDTLPPATTVAGPDFVMARSAEAVTPVVTEDVLFAALGSAVVEETLAVLVSDPA